MLHVLPFLISFFMIIFGCFDSYAAATSSNALRLINYDDQISLTASQEHTWAAFNNTVDYYYVYQYLHTSSTPQTNEQFKAIGSDGHWSFKGTDAELTSNAYIGFRFNKAALPPPGTYTMEFAMYADAVGYTLNTNKSLTIASLKSTVNAASNTLSVPVSDYDTYYNQVHFVTTIDINDVNYFDVYIPLQAGSSFGNANGQLKVYFRRTTDTPNISTVDLNIGSTPEQIQQNTSSGILSLLSSLPETIMGFFQSLMNNDNTNTQNTINSVNNSANQISNSMSNAADDINSGISSQTNTLTNGYNSSQLDTHGNNLNNSFTELDDLEDSIIDSVSDNLNYTFEPVSSSPAPLLASLSFCGNLIQRFFDAMGTFNKPIILSLSVTFACSVIGFKRFVR